jgi:putative SOS response-associated peptidase YedK
MCGRFTRYLPWSEIFRLYRLPLHWGRQKSLAPAFNIAPMEDVPFVTSGGHGDHMLRGGRWWLVPWWAEEMSMAAMFNARVETADTSSAFKDAFRSRRCLIPADGYYEWTKSRADGGDDPWHVYLPDHAPFSFAGLWAHNQTFGISSCAIITTEAIDSVKQIHDRMPIILNQAAYDSWLDPRKHDLIEAKSLLAQNLNSELEFYRVGRQINSPRYKGADCIRRVSPL